MRIIVRNMKLDVQKLSELVNSIVNNYNISVKMVEEPALGRQEIVVQPTLMKPVKYSPYFSQFYDERRAEIAEKMGEFEAKPKMKFGMKMIYLHWYHWALLNDVLTYILDSIGADYEIRTAAGKYRGWSEWRGQLKLPYNPELDPAFLKRVTEPVERFKGVPIYADREKMLDALGEVDVAIEAGVMKPIDIPDLEEKILEATRAKSYYEGIPVPESLRDCKPHFRAWLKMQYGEEAESVYSSLDEDARDVEYSTLMEWLDEVDPKSEEFKKYLRMWKEEVKRDIDWAITQYGKYEAVISDKDDAGFPLELARSLLTTPFKPGIEQSEVKKVVARSKEEAVENIRT